MNDLISKRDPGSYNWLALAAGLVMLPHVARVPIWLSLLFAAAIVWQWTSIHRAWFKPGVIIRSVLTFALLLAIFKEYGTLLGRDAGTGLLVGLAGLKFLELRTQRDYMMITFVFYMLVGVDFLYDQSLLHGAYLVAAMFLTTATLIRLHLPPTDDWKASLRVAGGLMVRALPLMLIMYLLFPRIQGGLWALPTDARSGKTGLSSEIRSGSISRLAQSDEIAFRVEFTGTVPVPEKRYWRALVLWNTDGKTWKQGQTSYVDSKKLKITTAGEPVKYTVTLEASGKHWQPALDIPIQEAKGSRYRVGYLVESRTEQHNRVRYELESYLNYHTGPLSEYERKLGLALPSKPGVETQNLVRKWRQGNTDRGVIRQALAHFNGQNFRYTLKPPLLGDRPVDEFLFKTQAGFCEHYATTFVTLMRLAGIPSRVVGGYQGGEYNQGGNYLIVRQSDAHAWTEVWLKDTGWTRVDPTAAVAPERIELGIDAIRRLEEKGLRPGMLANEALNNIIRLNLMENIWRQSRQALDAINLTWYRWTTGYDLDKQLGVLRKLGMQAPSWIGLVIGLFGGTALFVLAIIFALKRSEQNREPIQTIYRKFEAKLLSAGIKRSASEGPVDFARRVQSSLPPLKPAVQDITQLYVQLRYNPPAQDADKLETRIRNRVRAFKPKRLLADTEA